MEDAAMTQNYDDKCLSFHMITIEYCWIQVAGKNKEGNKNPEIKV